MSPSRGVRRPYHSGKATAVQSCGGCHPPMLPKVGPLSLCAQAEWMQTPSGSAMLCKQSRHMDTSVAKSSRCVPICLQPQCSLQSTPLQTVIASIKVRCLRLEDTGGPIHRSCSVLPPYQPSWLVLAYLAPVVQFFLPACRGPGKLNSLFTEPKPL